MDDDLPGDIDYIGPLPSAEFGSRDTIWIKRIFVTADARSQGYGRALIQPVLELADEIGAAVELECCPFDPGTEGALDAVDLRCWYERLGFQATGETIHDRPVLRREPRGA